MNQLVFQGNERYLMTCDLEAEAENLLVLLEKHPLYFLDVEFAGPKGVAFCMALDGIEYLKSLTEYEFSYTPDVESDL